MRKHDFVKLSKYTANKLTDILSMKQLVSGRVYIKNDPMECDLHLCDDRHEWNYVFFVYDDYDNSKFDIDRIFIEIDLLNGIKK